MNRRAFLKTSSTAGGAIAVTGQLSERALTRWSRGDRRRYVSTTSLPMRPVLRGIGIATGAAA